MALNKKLSAVALAALLVVGVSFDAEARGQRIGQIPNGGSLGCAGCHTDPNGGGPRNSFGEMIEDGFLTSSDWQGGVIWGPELAALDADGDGATNGEELGDPEGAWSTGDPDPGAAAAVTNPWDAESFPPPPEPTAVEGSTWAAVKALMQK